MIFDEIIDSTGWRASIGWMWEAVLRCRFSTFLLLRIFGCGGYTPVVAWRFFFATFSGTGAGRGKIDLSQQKGVLIWRMHDLNA